MKNFNSLYNRAKRRLNESIKILKSLLEEHLTRCNNYIDNVY